MRFTGYQIQDIRQQINRNNGTSNIETSLSHTETSQYPSANTLTYREKPFQTQISDPRRDAVQAKEQELERDMREILAVLEDKDMEMRENLERTEELEYLLEQQENTIRVLQERQNVSNERGAGRQVGLDLDHITPAFQREWQLEKMRYGLD